MNKFHCEAMSHDLFSTKFAKDGCADPLATTDYKEPPVVCYAIEIMESNMVRRNEQSKVSESVGCGREKDIQN